jgi:diguanylate cyclase (GGDEF)-like protein
VSEQRVLIVEEHASARVVEALRAGGIEVHIAPAAESQQFMRSGEYDLLVGRPDELLDRIRLEVVHAHAAITQVPLSEATLASVTSAFLGRIHHESSATFAWLVLEGGPALLEVSGPATLEPPELAVVAQRLLSRFAGALEPVEIPLDTEGASDPTVKQLLDRARWDQLVMVPLVAGEERAGSAFLARRGGRMQLAPATMAYFGAFAALAAVAIGNVRLYHRARTLSLTDAATGLPNARSLRDILPVMLALGRRSTQPLALAMLDSDSSATSDGLKTVNDLYGHEAGDSLVVQLARQISGGATGVRTSDVVARFTGGDEFVVVMPNTDDVQASIVAERLRAGIDRHRFVVAGHPVHCTVSIGVAAFPRDAETPEALIRFADRAMYEAKRRGKNQVVTYRSLAGQVAPSSAPQPPQPEAANT